MAKSKKRPQNKKLKAKKRKEASRKLEASAATNDAVMETLMQAFQFHVNGDHEKAVAICNEVLKTHKNHPEAFSLLGVIAHRTGNFEEAIKLHNRSIEIDPSNANYYSNLGAALNKSGDSKSAVEAYKASIKLAPENEQSYFNMAIALRNLGRLEESIECYEKVLEINPENTSANYNMGNALEDAGKAKEALMYQEMAQKIDPTHSKARYNKALLNLRLGNLKDGFRDYELRWLQEDAQKFPKELENVKMWDGSDLDGGTLLIYAEQGLGDVIQFIRYAEIIKKEKNVSKIILRCHPPLYPLIKEMDAIDEIAPLDKPLPEFNSFIPVLSLPYVMETDLDTIPKNVPYLKTDKEKIDKWKKLVSEGEYKIAIVWAGEPGHKNDHNRSCPIEYFETLMDIPGTVFYSIQKGHGERELPAALTRQKNLVNLGEKIKDFADTAAIMELVDLVISVDTSPIHLAGALNKKAWALIPFVPDWRWLLEREDCPWYPNMKLFRQTAIKDWESLFQRLKSELLKETGNAHGKESVEANAITNKGIQLEIDGLIDQAIDMQKQAIEIDDTNYKYHFNLALALRNAGRLEEAIEPLKKAISLNPEHLNSFFTYGYILQQLGHYEEAVEIFNKGLEIEPNDQRIIYNRSFIYLLKGEMEKGFSDYESRFKQPELASYPDFVSGKELWDGSDPTGKTILIHAEQGFGDMIQFIRYAQIIKDMGAKIVGECHQPLLSLLKQVDAVDEWLEDGKPFPHFDIHAPIMSLPHIMGTNADNIPCHTPYLKADPDLVKKWSDHIKSGKRKVAVVWSGRANHVNDHNRSIQLSQLEKIMDDKDTTFYSLQKNRDEDKAIELAKTRDNFIELGSKIQTFSDSAAIIDQMDLVISVDTAIVHLAGAMDKPVWTLLPFVPDWRWFLLREDSPWYPSMRLFRQGEMGNWNGVFERVKEALSELENE